MLQTINQQTTIHNFNQHLNPTIYHSIVQQPIPSMHHSIVQQPIPSMHHSIVQQPIPSMHHSIVQQPIPSMHHSIVQQPIPSMHHSIVQQPIPSMHHSIVQQPIPVIDHVIRQEPIMFNSNEKLSINQNPIMPEMKHLGIFHIESTLPPEYFPVSQPKKNICETQIANIRSFGLESQTTNVQSLRDTHKNETGEHVSYGSTFEPVILKNRSPLIIYEKRWYFRLVSAEGKFRSRALMDDYRLNELSHHLVICFTPKYIPNEKFDSNGNLKLFLNKDGEPIRIYALFDSYLEYFSYMQKFPQEERAFYEIIFGEIPQKPHFDIDIDADKLDPKDDLDYVANTLVEYLITACIDVLKHTLTPLNIEKDVLIYSSNSDTKRSYHVVLNNKCHDGHKEAKAFYDAIITKIKEYVGPHINFSSLHSQNFFDDEISHSRNIEEIVTPSERVMDQKISPKYIEFIDRSVYSPRQQFRIVGCQKYGSDRVKIFHEYFDYLGKHYNHKFSEDVTNPAMKSLTIIYESLVSFISGCTYIVSMIPEKKLEYTQQRKEKTTINIDSILVNQCMALLKQKMENSPFSVIGINEHMILLKRHAPSFCPICSKTHENENPFLYIISNKLYWDCRRCSNDVKKLFVGYVQVITPFDNNPEILEDADDSDEFIVANYLMPSQKFERPDKKESTTSDTTAIINDISDEQKLLRMAKSMHNTPTGDTADKKVAALQKDIAKKKYTRTSAENLTGYTLFDKIVDKTWKSGL